MAPDKISVMIVCLGNICRSPMGEAILQHVANQRGFNVKVSSCGTGNYHVGEEPDERQWSARLLFGSVLIDLFHPQNGCDMQEG